MKAVSISVLVAALVVAACRFEAPLVKEDVLPVDAGVTGLWEPVPEEGKKAEEPMLILAFSKTEYVIRQPLGDGVFHYRGYPIELGGVRCVQLEAIGTHEGPIDQEGKVDKPFQVVSYELADGKLTVRTLNEELFPDELKTTEALQEAFLKHKDREDLFKEAEVYRRAE